MHAHAHVYARAPSHLLPPPLGPIVCACACARARVWGVCLSVCFSCEQHRPPIPYIFVRHQYHLGLSASLLPHIPYHTLPTTYSIPYPRASTHRNAYRAVTAPWRLYTYALHPKPLVTSMASSVLCHTSVDRSRPFPSTLFSLTLFSLVSLLSCPPTPLLSLSPARCFVRAVSYVFVSLSRYPPLPQMNFYPRPSWALTSSHATCDMRHATCDMRHATCDMRHATCAHGPVWVAARARARTHTHTHTQG
jgi:hypothetical protein